MNLPILILDCWHKNPLILPQIAATNHQPTLIRGTLYKSPGGDPILGFPGKDLLPGILVMNPPKRLMQTLQLLLEGENCRGLSVVEATLQGATLNAKTWVTQNPKAQGAIRIKSGVWRR